MHPAMRLSVLILSILLMSSCSSRQKDKSHSDSIDKPAALLLPQIPDSLTDAGKRSEYALTHFWDNLDATNARQVLDTAFMEQSFSNFVALLPYVSEEVRQEAVTKLIDRCKVDTEVLRLVAWIAYKYLDDPNSPMRSEELLIPFLQVFSGHGDCLPEVIKERSAYRLKMAMKNRPGTQGADLRLVTREGQGSTLRRQVSPDTTIVMFYDPDCTHCREITEHLIATDSSLRYRIVAVDVAGDRQVWEATKNSLPRTWQVTFALDPVDEQNLYFFPALPSFYLIAPDGTILLKDFPLTP